MASSKTQKLNGPKINPKITPVPERGDAITQRKTFPTHKSQAKEIKSLLKQKGIPVTVKPID